MKKDTRSDKDVVAPEQKRKTIAELVGEYLIEIGFKAYGLANEHQVFTKDFCESGPHILCFLIKGAAIRIYKGFRMFRGANCGDMKRAISAHRLYECKASELEETLGLLAEQNYL